MAIDPGYFTLTLSGCWWWSSQVQAEWGSLGRIPLPVIIRLRHNHDDNDHDDNDQIIPSLANSPSLKSAGSTTGKQSLPTPLSQAVSPPANIS